MIFLNVFDQETCYHAVIEPSRVCGQTWVFLSSALEDLFSAQIDFFPLLSVQSHRMSRFISFLINQEIRLSFANYCFQNPCMLNAFPMQSFFCFLLSRGLFSRVSRPCVPLRNLASFFLRSLQETEVGWVVMLSCKSQV